MNLADQLYRQESDDNNTMRPVGLNDFLAINVPTREMLLDPILPERSLAMLYAPRGVGKTFLALAVGLAVASGCPLLRWNAVRPHRVLYVDGEMPISLLQERIKLISNSLGAAVSNDTFSVLAADATENGISISSDEGQRSIEPMLVGRDLVIFDNLATLTNGNENVWTPVQRWLLSLRRRGISVLLVHHSGTSGKQRGTSKREDALDTVIGLKKPADYKPEHGCRFEVVIEKCRHHPGVSITPFEARLDGNVWSHCDVVAQAPTTSTVPKNATAVELFHNGRSIREVAAATGLSKSSAWRLRRQLGGESGSLRQYFTYSQIRGASV